MLCRAKKGSLAFLGSMSSTTSYLRRKGPSTLSLHLNAQAATSLCRFAFWKWNFRLAFSNEAWHLIWEVTWDLLANKWRDMPQKKKSLAVLWSIFGVGVSCPICLKDSVPNLLSTRRVQLIQSVARIWWGECPCQSLLQCDWPNVCVCARPRKVRKPWLAHFIGDLQLFSGGPQKTQQDPVGEK